MESQHHGSWTGSFWPPAWWRETTPVLLVARYGTASAIAAYRVGHLARYDLEMVIWLLYVTIYLCFTHLSHCLAKTLHPMIQMYLGIIQWKWSPTTEICDVGFLLACTKRQKEEEGVHDLNPVINCHLLPAVSSQIFTDKTCWGPHEQQLHTVQPPQQDPQWQDEETWPRILIQTWQKNEENQHVQPIATL